MRRIVCFATGIVSLCLLLVTPSYAILGAGLHYSFDISVKMPDKDNDALKFDGLNLNTLGPVGAGSTAGFLDMFGNPAQWPGTTFGPDDIPIYFDRNGMGRTPFQVGFKGYLDFIPFIDCIELSGDLGAFEYQGQIRYPVGIQLMTPTLGTSLLDMIQAQAVSVEYDTMDLTLEGNGINFPGISGTPYVKLDLGLTVRKYIPSGPLKVFLKPYGGLGFDVVFTTPAPSAKLIKDAIGNVLEGDKSLEEIQNVLSDPENQEKITQELLNQLMTPHFGMNIVLGTMIKPPVFPFGVYAEGKFQIPFGPYDEGAEITGMGLRLNLGICLHIGK